MGYEMQIELDYKKKWDKIIKIVWRKVISLKISKFYADRDEPEITVMPKEDLVKFEAFLQEIQPLIFNPQTYERYNPLTSNDASFYNGFCSICLDQPSDIVLKCMHAFCES